MHITDHFIILLGKRIIIKCIANFASILLTGFSWASKLPRHVFFFFLLFFFKVRPKAWRVSQIGAWTSPQEEFEIIQRTSQALIALLIPSPLLDFSDLCFKNNVSDSTESPRGS